ncbi:golgin subfamily A member 4-like [Argopecten irradians]|uniref:golgin subfamily A member 4-like n=1 Tax=Argopecten irradians TaxID=31199 RepID=UPI0037188F63
MKLETEKSNVGTLETHCKDLKSELETEKSNVGTLETQCKDLQTELETEKSNVGTLETQCKDLKSELETEKSKVETLETQCEDLKSEVEIGGSNLNKYCEELKSELEKEKSNTRILETQIEDLKTETETNRSRLEKQCKDLKADLETERSNTVLLEKQCKDFSSKCSALQLQLIEQKECCKLVNSECEEQKEQYQQLWDTLEKERNTQENEILSLKSLMTQESENYYEREENFAQRFDAVNKELETLRIKDRNYEELQIKHNQVTSILEALHSQVERDTEGHKTEKLVMVHRMEQERKSFQSERQELVSKCEKLQDSLAGVEQNLDSLNLEYQTKFQDFCTEKDEFENDLESLRSELEETFNKERTCLQEQYVKLEREKGIAEKQFSIEKQQLEESIQCLKHENTELAGENLTLKSNKQTLIEEKTYLEENLRKIESELDQQRQQDRLAQQKFESTKLNFETQMESTRRALETEIETLKKGKVELDQKIVEEVETKERLLKECESLQHYNNELVLKFKTFETESEKKMLEMKEESCFLCGQLEEIQLHLEETVRKHTEEKQSLENQCTELREEVNVKQNVVDELNVALNLAKSKCDELEKMHLEKNSQSQALFEKLDSTNRENEDLVENFKQHVEDLEAEVKILHQQVKDSDKQNIEKEKSIESFQEEVTDLTESRDFYQAELTSTTEKLRLAGDARECLNTEIESLKQEVNDLKRNKHDLLSQVESLKNNMTENDSISEDFLSDLKSLTAERDGELTKNKELIHELKLRNERCEKLIIAREQLLKELNASEQLQAMLEKENEDIKKGNLTLIQECAALKELELQLKQDLKQRVNNEEKLREELKDLRQKLNDLEQEKSNISLDQGMLVNENLEDKNQALEQEISHLKENLAQIGEERDNLLNIHEAMAEDLSEMQHKYETVQSLMEDTKKECRKEIEKLQAQLGNVNSDMTAMKSSLELLEEDLNLSHDQKASLVLRLTREESRLQQTSPGSPDDSEDSYKSQKDMRNQRVASGTQRIPADIPVFMEDQQEQVSVSGFFQVEPHTDEDTVAQYEKNIEDLTRELENVKLENIQHQKSYQEEKAKLQRKIKDLEKIKNGDDQSSCDDRTSELVPQEADIETSYSEVAGLSAQEQEDKIEAIVEARITRRIEGMKYEMEEKVAFEIRSKEAEVADKYDKEFKKYKKEMEVYMKHKFETIRAEKDTAFLKAMQKVNKDADKRIKKEVERQRIKLLEERANEAGDGSSDSSGKVGSQIGDVVEKLHQENQDLAEARDALLQQVALSHHNQERLQEELRIMRGDEDSIHSDFPDNIPGESVVSEGGDYIQESDNDISHAKFSRPTYDSTSVMLDWELSPLVSFDYGRDENDSLEFVEHFECRRPRCRLIRQKFQELFDALPGSAGTSVTGDTEEENFNSDDSDSETDSVILQKEAVSKEGSFHPEEARAGYVAMDSMDPKNVPISSEKSGFFLGNQKDNLDNNFLHHETEKSQTDIVLTPEAGVGFQPEEGFVNVSGTDVNIGCGARSEFLPEDERIVGGENVENFIVDDVFESQIVPETMSRETDSQRMSIISGDDKEIIPESLAVCESKSLVDANRFQPEVEFHVESSPRTPGIDITEGFTREADEFENEDMFKAGDGFKPEKDDFSLEQDLVGDIMPITPTSELESELVREALRNAAQMVAPPYVAKTDICKAPVSEKVESRLAQKHQLVKRSKSAPSTEGFIEESDEAKEDKFIRSADCMTLTALHKDGNPLNESELLQGSSQQPKQNEMPSNQKHRSPTKTVATDSKTESEIIQRLRKDKKILEDKVASLLKEKQNLNDKQREITLQLENETLSRQHLEQELMGISDNFEKLPVSVAAKITKPEVLETDLLQSKLDIESQCKALQGEISSLETSICEKDELLKLERENFDGETKSLLLKIKDLEERLHSEEYNSIKSKTDSEQEITELRQRIAALTSVLEQDETKIDLDKQVDSLESQVKELVSDKNQLQHKCKELEGMLRETQMVALKEKTELDKELESIEGRTLMLSSANQDLKSKYVEMSNMQVDLMEEKKQLLEEKQALKSHLNEVLLDNQSLQTTCNDLEGLVQRTKDASITMEDQLKLLEDNLCETTAAKQELHLQCMEQESRLRAYGRSSELKGLSWEQKGTQTENAVGEETDTALQESTNKIEGLEAQLKEKERYVHKLQKDLEKSLSSSEKQKDFMQVKSGLEQTLREKDNYIKKLEEHFLRQGPLSIPTSGPSMLPVESESEETSSSGDSVAPHVVIENVEEHGLLQAHSTEANIGEDHSERQSDVELKIEDLADHSLVSESDLSHISVGNLSRVSVGDINELSTASAGMQSLPEDKNFGSKSISDKGPKLVAAISHSSPIASPRIISPRAPSTCSNTGSFNSSERLHAGFITEEDGHLESKHSELVDEIARLRKDLSETQAIYTKENVLLKEALDKDGSSREATKSKSSVSSMSFDSDSSQEVTRLRQKVATLEETNKMLQIENERWLRRIQDQEQVVIELRELLGRDEPNSDQTDSVFGKQITLLQNQRDHLLEKIHDFEMKNQRLTRKLGDNSILEESLRREKDLLYAKLCEKEDLERELSEKRLALEKQRHSQEQLEEILYHKNITEKELMRQKRLLEEELTEIESKLQEKEELLERQKNTLLRDIKRRGSSPPKLLSGSFSVALNDDGSPASSTFYLEGTPSTSTPKKPEATASPRELGRLELQVQEAERQHANAIQTLRQSLGGNPESQQGDTRQRYRGLLTSLRKEHLHKVPES